ncbi:Phospholipase D/Transphosphatidylase [Oceanicola granulosus HTCC2516]|uniref:Phospholipase D n=1 Tax=Oceanicola granulosus (strain ATCC BAA-861 / DSM 15982 / KCTC 12143 / HTCC2516) TaxID=314256 RepID=Q2CA33_OCEGH|nr:phospholipase D-like domain-containing protein [Oceanicola granulosus]EAR49532.1 Phospholipase D/Transphosphatidylase [Oceanicola granulosus HTCC2516]
MSAADDDTPILVPGDTCWRIAQADKLAVIVDAADYFSVIREVVQQATRSVLFIGWDFDTRIELEPDSEDGDSPNRLGRYLDWVVKENPDLHVHMLKWDLSLIETLMRGSTPLVIADWMTSNRIHMKLDHAHPSGAAHHQKIVVIDDVLAFCGGIDMTAERWDTRDHPDEDPRRRRPTSGRHYGPWHDITTAVAGPAARALGDLARDRWEWATGDRLEPVESAPPIWPERLKPITEHRSVGISRSLPPYGERDEVREIEALYLKVIEQTERTLYIESQYFASRKIAEAIVERLREDDPPEIVIVNPFTAQGWLEEEVMGTARVRLLELVRRADHRNRFRLYTPQAENGTHIYVHAKVVIMDDRLLRVGSSNLNNRSMGFDSECDLTIEVRGESDQPLRERIVGLRNDLIAEHLGVENAEVEACLRDTGGSMLETIERLRGEGRTLVPFELPDFSEIEDDLFAESDLLDPESTAKSAWWHWT